MSSPREQWAGGPLEQWHSTAFFIPDHQTLKVAGVAAAVFTERRPEGVYALVHWISAGEATLIIDGSTTSLTIAPAPNPWQTTRLRRAIWHIPTHGDAATMSAATLREMIAPDFADIAALGYDTVTYAWHPVRHTEVLYDVLRAHKLDVIVSLRELESIRVDRYDGAPLIAMYDAMRALLTRSTGQATIATDPRTFGVYLRDEPLDEPTRLANQLEAMMIRWLAPRLAPMYAIQGAKDITATADLVNISATPINTFELYPFYQRTAPGDLSKEREPGTMLGHVPLPDFIDWMRATDPLKRPLELILQACGSATANELRPPTPHEFSLLVGLGVLKQARVFTSFIYGWGGPGTTWPFTPSIGRTGHPEPGVLHPMIRIQNARLAALAPLYDTLVRDDRVAGPVDPKTLPPREWTFHSEPGREVRGDHHRNSGTIALAFDAPELDWLRLECETSTPVTIDVMLQHAGRTGWASALGLTARPRGQRMELDLTRTLPADAVIQYLIRPVNGGTWKLGGLRIAGGVGMRSQQYTRGGGLVQGYRAADGTKHVVVVNTDVLSTRAVRFRAGDGRVREVVLGPGDWQLMKV